MNLVQLIYVSRPFDYDNLCLDGILAVARHNNTRDGITGALICREDIYLQLLEGPSDHIANTYARIRHDDRHIEVVKLAENAIDQRMFGNWAMHHDPALSCIWSPAEVQDGAMFRAPKAAVLDMFARMRREVG